MIADKIYYAAVDRITELEAALAERDATIAAALGLHQQTGGMGYYPDSGSSYGQMSSVCDTCGTADEYGTPWPCETYKILSTAPGDALTVHKSSLEVKAQALEEAAVEFATRGGYGDVVLSLVRSAKAIREEGRSHD